MTRRVVEPGGIDFSTWYTDERDRLVRALVVISGDPEGARDAVAEAFSRAYERWRRVATSPPTRIRPPIGRPPSPAATPYAEEEAGALVFAALPPGAETVEMVHDDGRTVTAGLVIEPTRRFWAMPIRAGDNPETAVYRNAAGTEVARFPESG